MALMKLADGTMFDTVTKKTVKVSAEEATPLPELSFIPAPRSSVRLEELPAAPKQMTIISAILGFKYMGLPDTEICYALNCELAQLHSITATDAYTKAEKMIMDAFVLGQTRAARDIIMSNAQFAAQTMVTEMRTAKTSKDRQSAANSVLNRAGIGEDTANDGMGSGLIIKIVRDADTSNIKLNIEGM